MPPQPKNIVLTERVLKPLGFYVLLRVGQFTVVMNLDEATAATNALNVEIEAYLREKEHDAASATS